MASIDKIGRNLTILEAQAARAAGVKIPTDAIGKRLEQINTKVTYKAAGGERFPATKKGLEDFVAHQRKLLRSGKKLDVSG